MEDSHFNEPGIIKIINKPTGIKDSHFNKPGIESTNSQIVKDSFLNKPRIVSTNPYLSNTLSC